MPHRPPDSRDHTPSLHARPGCRPTWRGVAVSYALIPAFFLVLWASSQPALALMLLGTGVGVAAVGRRVVALARCVSACDALTVGPVGTVQLTIRQVDRAD